MPRLDDYFADDTGSSWYNSLLLVERDALISSYTELNV